MTKKKKSAKKAKTKPAKKVSRRVRKPGPRSLALPGMEQVRNVKLDNVCESIAEEREEANAARVKEKQLTAAALKVMQERNVTVYKHAGVELIRVPGADKLRLRLVSDTGDASVDDGVTRSDSETDHDDGEAVSAMVSGGDAPLV